MAKAIAPLQLCEKMMYTNTNLDFVTETKFGNILSICSCDTERKQKYYGIWLVGFVALRPKSIAMVIAGRSVHLTTLFPGQA